MLSDPVPAPAPSRPGWRRGLSWLLVCVITLLAQPGPAAGEVLFRVHGLPMHPDPSGLAIDRNTIDAMPQQDYVTGTVWTDGVSRFSGVLLSDFLAAIGADGQQADGRHINDRHIEIRAIDGYLAVIPFSEIDGEAPLLATRIDGIPILRRERGPVWLVYPYDRDPMFRTDTILLRSIWQIERIDIHGADSP